MIERNAVRCLKCSAVVESMGSKVTCPCGNVTVYGGVEVLGRLAPTPRGYKELSVYRRRTPFVFRSTHDGLRLVGDMPCRPTP